MIKPTVFRLILLCLLCLISLTGCAEQNTRSETATSQAESHSDSPANNQDDDMDMSNMTVPESDDMDMSDLNLETAGSAPSKRPSSPTPASSPLSPDPFTRKAGQTIYRCPMHPQIVSDEPGQCSICGMDLEPVQQGGDHAEHASGIPGLATIQLTPRKQQLIGVKTALVEKRPLKQTIRTVGTVDYNKQAITHVHTKYKGWLEEVFVDFEGKFVAKGQPLFSIYSPDLVAAQNEYLIALQTQAQFIDSDLVTTRETSHNLVEAARQKLRYWDLTPGQIATLSQTGHIYRSVTVYAPASGHVLKTQAIKGMLVTPGMQLYTLANLSTVWIQAQIYEYEIPLVKMGQYANITLPFLPGKAFTGRVSFIDPYLNPKTRTASVRFELNNSQNLLKPEMFADVEIKVPEETDALTIPVSAVMDSGQRQIVYQALKDGYFKPQEVKLGRRVGDYYILKTGPDAGAKVVVDANFLIDSESQLQAAISGMGSTSEGHQH